MKSKLVNSQTLKVANYPSHVAFIVDGNRRWARKRALPEIAGHRKAAYEVLDALIFHCLKLGIPYITFWAFSTENWKRGKRFYNALFKLLAEGLGKNMDKYNKAGVCLKVIGDLTKIPTNLRKKIEKKIEASKKNKKITVVIGLNYGGRDEILRAIKKIYHSASSAVQLESRIHDLNEKSFSQFLDTVGIPDPDLVIRTGGAMRLSGFLLWQSEYSEFYFTKTLMPDFTIKEFEKALEDYNQRQRRFGK